jgi:hypothetical protein
MTIDLSGLPRSVSLRIGELIEIQLPSYAGSGYIWSAKCLRGAEVARVSMKLGDQPPKPSVLADGKAEPPEIVQVPEFVVIEGLAYGEATWRLVLARSFDRSNPAATYDVDVCLEKPA